MCAKRDSTAYNPFVDWHFLHALEASGSVGQNEDTQTGWQVCHIWLEDTQGHGVGAAPLYLKYHSRGEYVFDQGWANAAEGAGLAYYPKLQCAVPFTPATGPRLLAPTPEIKNVLIKTMQDFCLQNQFSGVHISFCDEDTQSACIEQGFLARTDRQFHFINRGYKNFDAFLASLTSRKRKKIKSERRRACENITIKRLRGDDIKTAHWDAFFAFYIDTSERKWGQAYLTREFFARIHDSMRDQILLMIAYDGETPVAGALNFIGGDTLFGRQWGCNQHIPFLHFELCYYQAIEAGIELGLAKVEAGAQGEHKLARGYEPTTTYSAHFLAHPGLRDAIDNFLAQERRAVAHEISVLDTYSPFKNGE